MLAIGEKRRSLAGAPREIDEMLATALFLHAAVDVWYNQSP